VEELLKEVKVPYEKLGKLEAALHALKQTLEGLPVVGERPIDEAVSLLAKQGVVVPFAIPDGIPANFKLSFAPPSHVDLVGSYLLRTNAKPNLNIDVAVEMPESLFRNKDHLNYCYSLKRAYFLSVLALHLSKSKAYGGVRFSTLDGNTLRPILLLSPSGGGISLSSPLSLSQN